jgi:ribokinase
VSQPVVLVVGSINADTTCRVTAIPAPGETTVAHDVIESPGGKGANQAASAARAGATVRLVGAVGEDAAGAVQLEALRILGVDTEGVARLPGARTGSAFVVVSATDADNTIVVDPGANALVPLDRIAGHVAAHVAAVGPGAVVVIQSEMGATLTDAAARACADHGARAVINNGPWQALAADTLRLADPLVVNEHEAAQALEEDGATDLAAAVRRRHGSASVVVTHGGAGASVSDGSGAADDRMPAQPALRVVSTTGAGDAFVGALAVALAHDRSLRDAVQVGLRAGAEAVGWDGARPPGV